MFHPGDGFLVHGIIYGSMKVRLPDKTQFVPSPIHGFRDVTTCPAPLTIHGMPYTGTPLYHGVRLSTMNDRMIEEEILMIAFEDTKNKILSVCKPMRMNVGKLSICDAIVGLPIEGYDSMAMDTSEGWPWVKLRPIGQSSKKWLFDEELEPAKILKAVVERRNVQRENGVTPTVVYSDSLKDAKISISKKFVPGKTRVFGAGPVDATISHRQYLLDFLASFRGAGMKCEHGVGIDPTGPEWMELCKELLVHPNHFTGDHSKFGQEIPKVVGILFVRMVNEWYDLYSQENVKENLARRVIVEEEIFSALHIVHDCVVQFAFGQPNGGVGTVMVDVFWNMLLFRMSYIKLSRAARIETTLADYSKYVFVCFWGDDVIGAVANDVAPWFTNQKIAVFLESMGMKYTTSAKVIGAVPDFDHPHDLQFIGRKFVRHPKYTSILLAPISGGVIESLLNWQWRSDNDEETFLDNYYQALLLAYDSGPEWYRDLKRDVEKRLHLLTMRYFPTPSWEELDSQRVAKWNKIKYV